MHGDDRGGGNHDDGAGRGGPPPDAPEHPAAPDESSPRPPIASLLPTYVVVAAVTLLVGAPLWVQGYTFDPLREAARWLGGFAATVAIAAAVRLVGALARGLRTGRLPRPTRREILRQAGSLVVTLGAVAGVGPAYTWGKLLIPLFRGETLDSYLYAADIAVHLGLDPAQVVVALLTSLPGGAAAIDWSYDHYLLLLMVTIAWFLTTPDVDRRHRFARGFVLLWLSGLAVYWALPALGPAFVFPDLAPVLAEHFPRAQALQARLLENYEGVLDVIADRAGPQLEVAFGIAAMPSLHVGVPAFGFFWCRAERHWLRWPYLAVLLVMLVGSVATGWHYLIDGYVGILIAWACVRAVGRAPASTRSCNNDAAAA